MLMVGHGSKSKSCMEKKGVNNGRFGFRPNNTKADPLPSHINNDIHGQIGLEGCGGGSRILFEGCRP